MQPEQLVQAQQPFERLLHNSVEAKGYGLGLDIVRRVCERYGWQLVINSQIGKGTQVIVYIS
jgi:signal transduction histidine kinase